MNKKNQLVVSMLLLTVSGCGIKNTRNVDQAELQAPPSGAPVQSLVPIEVVKTLTSQSKDGLTKLVIATGNPASDPDLQLLGSLNTVIDVTTNIIENSVARMNVVVTDSAETYPVYFKSKTNGTLTLLAIIPESQIQRINKTSTKDKVFKTPTNILTRCVLFHSIDDAFLTAIACDFETQDCQMSYGLINISHYSKLTGFRCDATQTGPTDFPTFTDTTEVNQVKVTVDQIGNSFKTVNKSSDPYSKQAVTETFYSPTETSIQFDL